MCTACTEKGHHCPAKGHRVIGTKEIPVCWECGHGERCSFEQARTVVKQDFTLEEEIGDPPSECRTLEIPKAERVVVASAAPVSEWRKGLVLDAGWRRKSSKSADQRVSEVQTNEVRESATMKQGGRTSDEVINAVLAEPAHMTYTAMALKHGVSQPTVHAIRKGKLLPLGGVREEKVAKTVAGVRRERAKEQEEIIVARDREKFDAKTMAPLPTTITVHNDGRAIGPEILEEATRDAIAAVARNISGPGRWPPFASGDQVDPLSRPFEGSDMPRMIRINVPEAALDNLWARSTLVEKAKFAEMIIGAGAGL